MADFRSEKPDHGARSGMSYEGRNTVVALVTNLCVVTFFAWRLLALHRQGAFDGPSGLATWAQCVLWIIPASVGVSIVLAVLLPVLAALVWRDDASSFVVDERDKAFAIKAMSATIVVASAGFILALVVLAWGRSALLAFNIILAAFALGDLAGSLAKLYFYRRGY